MRRGASKVLVGVALVLMLFDVVGLAFVFFPPSTSGRNSSSGGLNSTPQNASLTSALGLKLSVTLNSTGIRQGEAIGVTAELVNTLKEDLTLYPDFATYSNITAWGPYSTNVCNWQPILVIAVFQGNYTSGDISTAGPPLQLAEPYPIPCAAPLTLTRITFLPGSHTAAEEFVDLAGTNWTNIEDIIFSLSPFKSVISTNGQYTEGGPLDGAAGYYTAYTGGSSVVAFHQFPAGPYTVVVADVWGQTVFLRFNVE